MFHFGDSFINSLFVLAKSSFPPSCYAGVRYCALSLGLNTSDVYLIVNDADKTDKITGKM